MAVRKRNRFLVKERFIPNRIRIIVPSLVVVAALVHWFIKVLKHMHMTFQKTFLFRWIDYSPNCEIIDGRLELFALGRWSLGDPFLTGIGNAFG